MFQAFMEETESKSTPNQKPTLRNKAKKNFLRRNGKKEEAPSSASSEFRDDYTVKTFVGHTEGILCVAADTNVLASGSWY